MLDFKQRSDSSGRYGVVQKPFDQFAKRLFTAAWEGTGVVQTDAEVLVDAQFIDLWFEPDPTRDAERATRGLVGAMGREVCGLEVFRKTPDLQEVFECLRKQFTQHHNRVLAAKRNEQPVPEQAVMWVVSSGRPKAGMAFARMRRMKGWPRGFYEGGPGFLFRIIVVRALPVTRETLVLRLLGTGKTRQAALQEFNALPEDAWEREVATPALVDLRMLLAADTVTYTEGSDEQEFLMTTQSLYEQWSTKLRQEGRQEGLDDGLKKGRLDGLQEGIQRGEREALTRLFMKRLGRALTEGEQQIVAARHEKLGLSRLEDVALELRGEDLKAWLADPAGV